MVIDSRAEHPQWPDRNNRAIGTQCGHQVRKIYLQSVWPDHPNRTHGTTTSLGQSAYENVPSTCGDNEDRVPGFTRQKNQPRAIDVPYRFQLDTRQRHFTCQLFPGLGSGWTSGLDDLYRRRCGDVYVRSHRPTKIGHLPETGVRRSNVLLRCQWQSDRGWQHSRSRQPPSVRWGIGFCIRSGWEDDPSDQQIDWRRGRIRLEPALLRVTTFSTFTSENSALAVELRQPIP